MKTKTILFGTIGIILSGLVINFLPLISRQTIRMDSYQRDDIQIYAEPQDISEVKIIGEKIISSRDRITNALEGGNSENIRVIIYPNHKVLHRKTLGFVGALLPDWYIGKNTKNHVLITSPRNPGPEHDRQSIEKAAVHEFVHLMTDRRNKPLSYWLKEGFALFLADQKPDVEAVRNSHQLTYEEYRNPNAIQFANVDGYILAYTLIEFLKDEFGWERILGFLTPKSDSKKVLGISEQELFNQWQAWLKYY